MTVLLHIQGVDRSDIVEFTPSDWPTPMQGANHEIWWFENWQDDSLYKAHFTYNGVTYTRTADDIWRTKEEIPANLCGCPSGHLYNYEDETEAGKCPVCGDYFEEEEAGT